MASPELSQQRIETADDGSAEYVVQTSPPEQMRADLIGMLASQGGQSQIDQDMFERYAYIEAVVNKLMDYARIVTADDDLCRIDIITAFKQATIKLEQELEIRESN